MNVFETLVYYFSFGYVRNAFIVCVLVAMCSSLLGVILVMKRLSFIGDGLSHIAFGAMAVSSAVSALLQMTLKEGHDIALDTLIVLPVTLLAAVLLLRSGPNSKIKGDALIAVISVSALAIGYLIMNMFSLSSNVSGDVCSALFGSSSIITLTFRDVCFSLAVSAVALIIFLLLYNRLFSVTFDESFARATGLRTDAYNLLIACLIAFIVVIAMELVGSLLISALVVFPALSAMRVAKSFRAVVLISLVCSVCCAALGVVLSVLLGTPVGATVVILDLAAFAAFSAAGKLRRFASN